MKNKTLLFTLTSILVLTFAVSGCGSTNTSTTDTIHSTETITTTEAILSTEVTTVDIVDIHGTVTVPIEPKTVVSLDNRTFETLSDWGIHLAAVPKDVMPTDSLYVLDEAVQNIGNHREPNLELIAAVEPDLVIVGQRFASYYEEIKALVPNASVIDLSFDVSETATSTSENLVNGLQHSTTTLGQIFNKHDEAKALNTSLDQVIEEVKTAYVPDETIMTVIVSGGSIGYSAPKTGRVWGPMYELFNWTNALDVNNTTSDHQGDDISVEAIAQSNPDWLLVLDRDAATSDGETSLPATDVIDNSLALANVNAIVNEQIIYAPVDTYTNEFIQTYLELFQNLTTTFAK